MTQITYSMEQIKMMAPSIFTDGKASHLSDKYIQTPTSKLVEDLIMLGWEITKAQEVKARKGKGFQKHIVVFRNPSIMIMGKDGDDAFPQIMVTNSHDGKNAFNFRVGLYRLICSNGLVIADAEFSNVSIRHMNYTFGSLQVTINEIISKLPNLVNKINVFKTTLLSDIQMNDFAFKAAKLRNNQTINAAELLQPLRLEDTGNDLWKVFNRVEEKIISGGYGYGRKMRKTRTVKNFNQDIKLNEQLWLLADSYVQQAA